jgi:hypothetical protein
MPITNGSTIVASEINSSLDTALTALQAENAIKPSVYWIPIDFYEIASDDGYVERNFVMPDDSHLVEMSVHGNPTEGWIDIEVDNGALIEPITVNALVANGYTKLTRWYATSGRAYQVFLKGSTVTVTAYSTDATTLNGLTVMLGFASRLRRF